MSEANQSATHTEGAPIQNAVKLLGEAMMPGASLLMDGKILTGGAHLVVGALAKAALGPLGVALVVANSYSLSSTGKSLLKQFTKADDAAKQDAAKAAPAPAAKPADAKPANA